MALAPQICRLLFDFVPVAPSQNVNTHHITSVSLLYPYTRQICTSLLLIIPGHDGAAHAVLLDLQIRLLQVRLAALALGLVVFWDQLPQLRLDLVVGPPLCGVLGGGVFWWRFEII